MTKQELIFQLARRPHGDLQEAAHVGIAASTAALRDIGSYRTTASSHLTGQSVYFLFGKTAGTLVHGECHPMRFLPHFKISEILHVSSSVAAWLKADS
jgi:hypothetical protein